MKLYPYLSPCTNQFKLDQRLETLKLLEDKTCRTFQDIDKEFLKKKKTPKVQEIFPRIVKWDYMKLKLFHIADTKPKNKQTKNRVGKKQPTQWE